MMGTLWVVLFVALTGSHLGYGLPVRPTPQAYPHDASTANAYEGWGTEGAYAAVPALALVLTAVGLLFGCTWCYRHKDCKLFTASAAHLHEARRVQPPDSGFSEPANNNISEDNNNGPISLREMQNIANNNAAAYIVSENEERNRVSRESVVEFEPLPTGIRVADPLEHCADWFGGEDFSRNRLQYLREIGRGWFGRVVEGEIDDAGTTSPVAVKILNQNASLEDKARFLDEARLYRNVRHENILAFVTKCLQEDPWILIFELCSMDLQQYLIENRPKMAILNESGVPLRLMCDVTAALAYLHSRGYLYGNVWSGGVLVRGAAENARGVLGQYVTQPQNDAAEAHGSAHTSSSEVCALGTVIWEVCAWGAAPRPPPHPQPHPPPDLPCPYRNHLYQVMQLCWQQNPESRPTAAQVHALIDHLYMTHLDASDVSQDDGYGSTDFEERWQRLKPNTIPKLDEHVAIVHAPSTSMASHFTGSDQELDNSPTIHDTLSVDMDTAVSRSSSIMSDKDPLSVQIKSESLTNLHGSLEDVRNIYLTHNEMAVLDCHQGNISLEESREKEQDRSDSSMDPWLKDIIAGSQDDVSYYRDVSDVIKNLDNILNSEKTSSSESSHQASPSRDNLSLDCKKDYQAPSCMVKSPGINNFQNFLESGFATKSEDEPCEDEDTDRETIGTLSHSFERHSDTLSQHTLENLTPDTPNRDLESVFNIEVPKDPEENDEVDKNNAKSAQNDVLPKGIDVVSSDSEIPKLKELCESSINSVSVTSVEQLNVIKDCQTPCDNNFTEIRTDIKEETKSIDDIGKPNVDSEPLEDVGKIDTVGILKEERTNLEKVILPEPVSELTVSNHHIDTLPLIETELCLAQGKVSNMKAIVNLEDDPLTPESIEGLIKDIDEPLIKNDLIVIPTDSMQVLPERTIQGKQGVEPNTADEKDVGFISASEMTPESVQNINDIEKFHDTNNIIDEKEAELIMVVSSDKNMPPQILPPDTVQNIKEYNVITETEEANDFNENMNYADNNTLHRSETEELIETKDQFYNTNSTVYMDLINDTNSEILNANILDNSTKDNIIDGNIKEVIQSCLESAPGEGDCCIVNNDSTIYLDLPSFVVKKETDNFLHMERMISCSHSPDNIFASTPKGTDSSSEYQHEQTLENSVNPNETQMLSEIENTGNETRIFSEIDNSINENVTQTLSEIENSLNVDETKILTGLENSFNKIETQVLPKTENTVDENETQIVSEVENSVNDNETQIISEFENSGKGNETQIISEFENSGKVNETQIISEIENTVDVNERQIIAEVENSVNDNDAKNFSEIENTIDVNETQLLSGLKKSDKETEAQVLTEVESSTKKDETQILPEIESSFNVTESQASTETENSVGENETRDSSGNETSAEVETASKENKSERQMVIENSVKNSESHVLSETEKSDNDNETIVLFENENSIKDNESQLISELENSVKENETQFLSEIETSVKESESKAFSEMKNLIQENENFSEIKDPYYGPGVSVTKLEQRYVPENMSPFESPTKSHHTDTYDENSSVVLGPFENCTLDLFKGLKSSIDNIDIPKEELLAFSSNFSEMNLATPSPLRDGNFLNEVPDILHDDVQFDDIDVISEVRTEPSEPISEDTDQSGTEKHVSPSTPPNSPGIFLASTSHQKYLVDIDLNPEPQDPDFNLQNEIELNQIELQITSKLAMAENENNLNIEYSGPLTVEGLVEEGVLMRESDAIPESYLAGNGGSLEDLREDLTLDEECVKALRNELELKLPLAQVAAIEPQLELEADPDSDSETPEPWAPAPPELVVSYPPALSPIAEETRQQLSAYENDINWYMSNRTESSESYPEPCNNSTDDVTELPTAAQDQSTYTLHSKEHSPHNTYTVQKEIMSSKEITMSADSLNASPYRKPIIDPQSPVDETTYIKNDDEKESNCERISQVSPFLLSPTTDTSAPENSDNFDNATGVSTLSKTTLPTDAKLSKPSETQCLSKATSIDSWCSNDTLYNVEENFDDLGLDPDVPIVFEHEKEEGGSESTDTLTHNDDEKEHSHCSTYIIHDSKSEVCETFSPDSITENDNYTYTKVKTDAAATPSFITKSELNDSTKTKDLAYGTLMSGLPSFSNCSTEITSAVDDVWKLQQPELVRRSPIPDDINITPPKFLEHKDILDESSPKLIAELRIKKMDSVELPCLEANSMEELKYIENDVSSIEVVNSPENNYRNMAPSVTSTPLTEVPADCDKIVAISMKLPEIKTESPECSMKVPNFISFQQSAEVRPQDLSSDTSNGCTNQDTELLLEGETKSLSRDSNRDSMIASERTPTYSDFESSATTKPQDVQSKSSQSLESGVSSEDFRQFENSVRNRPQDLSSMIDASCLLLNSERMSSELAMVSSTISYEPTKRELSPPNISNLIESHIVNVREPANMFLINVDEEEETEQPHSIIITESSLDAFKETPNKTYDSHTEVKLIDLNHTYDSHVESVPNNRQTVVNNLNEIISLKINGTNEQEENFIDSTENKSPTAGTSGVVEKNATIVLDNKKEISNGSFSDDIDIKCNGSSEKFAIVNFLSETFEELIESNVDDSDTKDAKVNEEQVNQDETLEMSSPPDNKDVPVDVAAVTGEDITTNGVTEVEDDKITLVTEDFLQNEKKFCQIDSYLPLLSDIRFTGPATEIMSTSFTQDSPTEPTSPECDQCEQDNKPNIAAEIAKDWDSDSDSHSSNSSSGEFIWKQRGNAPQPDGADNGDRASDGGVASDGSGDSGSGSEGDEVEFVPSSWDCRAAPSKSSLRSLEAQADNKKRVVFKRQKYHCVYEYPREAADLDAHSPAYLPDLSTYSEWTPSSMEDAELGYGQLFSSAPSALDLYPIPAGIAFGADYDEDFFISSSARPFESLGIMSTTSQFFPGMHIKPSLLERDLPDDIPDDFPPPPSPLATTTLVQTRTPSLDFTTPDSGVEDITPGSTIDEDFKAKKMPETELTWRPVDSASSSESVSPSSPGGEALGGLRHTRDKLKLDLPPSPHIPPSPRHNRVFNFVLDKPKRRSQEERPVDVGTTPIVMTDETPIVTTTLPLQKECEELPAPEPTFSTFGKSVPKPEPEQKAIILTDEIQEAEPEVKVESPKVVEAVKGEGTVLDSGDEDSGIESSSKATLERNKTPNVS